MTALISVESSGTYIPLPPPSVYEATPNEVVEAERTVEGDMVKERITIKRSIVLEWPNLLSAQSTQVAALTSPNTFRVRYFDPETKTFQYGMFYRGNDYEHKPLQSADSRWDGSGFKRWVMSMSLVEV